MGSLSQKVCDEKLHGGGTYQMTISTRRPQLNSPSSPTIIGREGSPHFRQYGLKLSRYVFILYQVTGYLEPLNWFISLASVVTFLTSV